MDSNGNEELPSTYSGQYGSQAAMQRIFFAMGARLESFGQSVRWDRHDKVLVYNVQLRAAIREQQDVLMMVKGVGPDGPVIAFHSDRTMIDCIESWPARLNAGKISWKEDEFPPKNYQQIMIYAIAQLEYHLQHWGDAPQGSEAVDNS